MPTAPGSGIISGMSTDHHSHERARFAAAIPKVYRRVFAFDDPDVDVVDTSAVIELGKALPAGAFVLGVSADVVDFTDGGAGTFTADVGDGTDDDKFTPTALDIDGGDALLEQSVFVSGGGDQLTVTITGSVNLSTLTAGSMDLRVLFVVPDEQLFAAPEA